MLTGLLACGRCGDLMCLSSSWGSGAEYVCGTGFDVRSPALDVEGYVLGVVMARLALPDAQATVLPRPGARPADPAHAFPQVSVTGMRAVVSTLVDVTAYPAGRGRQPFRPETVGIEWRSEPGETDGSGLAAQTMPDAWWEEITARVEGEIGRAAEALVGEQAPPPLTGDQRRALWVALAPAARTAADAEGLD